MRGLKQKGAIMKKSQIYTKAMEAVIRDKSISLDETLEILAVLMDDKRSAIWSEEREKGEGRELSNGSKQDPGR